MIFLSILGKTLAITLALTQPWVAVGCWLASTMADCWATNQRAPRRLAYWTLAAILLLPLAAIRQHWGVATIFLVAGATANYLKIKKKSPGEAGTLQRITTWQISAAIMGLAAYNVVEYAGTRWKVGIPLFAEAIAAALHLIGLPAGSSQGTVALTTMSCNFQSAASINQLGLQMPVVFLILAASWLCLMETSPVKTLQKLGYITGIAMILVVIRMTGMISLAYAAIDFVGGETEQMPFRPFMGTGAEIWPYLPCFLLAGPLIGKWLPRKPDGAPKNKIRAIPAVGLATAAAVLAIVACWKPVGTPKKGKVVIATGHTLWSRVDRPYDTNWYGPLAGYNYACVKQLLEKFYQVQLASKDITKEELTDTSTLIIYDPDKGFSPEEIKTVQEFVQAGGGLLLIGDHTNVFGGASNMNDICKPMGMKFGDDVLFDLDIDYHQIIKPPRIPNPLWQGTAFFKLRGPTSITPTSVWTDMAYTVDHSKSERAVYSIRNFYPPPHDHPKMKTGRFCVAASAHYGKGRVVAWGDSTLFSNFEIFYPGKYEFLLNATQWLNKTDKTPPQIYKGAAAIVLLIGVAFLFIHTRNPKVWLATTITVILLSHGAQWLTAWRHQKHMRFQEPIQQSNWLAFLSAPDDKNHALQHLAPEGPMDQRYTVFIQWMLRTNTYPSFHTTGATNGLYNHLRTQTKANTALALILRDTADLPLLQEMADTPPKKDEPILLIVSATIAPDLLTRHLKTSGLVKDQTTLDQIPQKWNQPDFVVFDGTRKIVVVTQAEKFSDANMGLSERVEPNPTQMETFRQSFRIPELIFGAGPTK